MPNLRKPGNFVLLWQALVMQERCFSFLDLVRAIPLGTSNFPAV